MKNKIIAFFMIIAVLMIIIPCNVFAGYTGIDTDISIGDSDAVSASKPMTERILGRVQVIGTIISVMALVIIGIRYMSSSVEEKADMKGVLIYYVIGAVLVFATVNLLSIAYEMIFVKLAM